MEELLGKESYALMREKALSQLRSGESLTGKDGALDNILRQSVEHLKENFRQLKNGLIKWRDYIFMFFENPAISPDNNASERGIRKLKIKQKISGTFRTDDGADAFMATLSVADTAWKNKQSPFNTILTVMQ